ncbi:MAG: GH92 family glycosyl hydrolase [Clostridia bacterium]|nr:GH92 family glycosyl hydrolase [Clostridia bacterium]
MNYLPLVNIKQGTKSVDRFSNGNTLPLTQLPFAMVGFAPQTKNFGSWFYHPDDRSLNGIRITHQPSPWISDYGAFLLTPQTGKIYDNIEKAWSSFRPEEAILTPNYLKVRFLRSQTDFELTPRQRSCKIKLNFPENRDAYLSVFPISGKSHYEIDEKNNCVKAYTTGHKGDIAKKFKEYIIIKFDCPIDVKKSKIMQNSFIHIALKEKKVNADISTSYLSFEQAKENMKQDCSIGFDDAKKDGEKIWEEYLSRIEIETDSEKQLKTFYSCMYRTGLFPHKAYEINSAGKKIHYCPFDGKIKDGVRYTDNGFWDTYRTEYPLLALIGRDEYAEILEGFIADYKDGGWLPRWPSIGERGCMPSSLLDAVIADAAVKEIISGDLLETGFRGMLKHANTESKNKDIGREGVKGYLKYGYVPKDKHKASVNLTLDAAYGDFCIAQVAKVLGHNEYVDEYMKRSKNYKNLFDAETGFMRGRKSDGSMDDNFDCFDWGGDYTEGSAWQSSFAVPHDLDGLAELYGSKEKLFEKLDELFATPPVYNVGGYGCEIHEMSEMAAADFGQCAISNQPSFHIPYIYAALGNKEKTEFWIKKLCEEAFSYEDDGFPGDEDNGSMSAWYILSTLGIYDICPGKNEYIRIQKLVKSAKILGKEI